MNFDPDFETEDKPLILIVDDILNNLQIIGNTLIDEGYEISMAQNGKQALEMVENIQPDLILLDVMMPEMDGFEACAKFKENEMTKNIPIIFLTAKNETEDIVKGFEVGGIDYIVKPFNSSELLARVKTYLELKRSRELNAQINTRLRRMNEEKDRQAKELEGPAENLLVLLKDMKENFEGYSKEDLGKKIKMANNFAKKITSIVLGD